MAWFWLPMFVATVTPEQHAATEPAAVAACITGHMRTINVTAHNIFETMIAPIRDHVDVFAAVSPVLGDLLPPKNVAHPKYQRRARSDTSSWCLAHLRGPFSSRSTTRSRGDKRSEKNTILKCGPWRKTREREQSNDAGMINVLEI